MQGAFLTDITIYNTIYIIHCGRLSLFLGGLLWGNQPLAGRGEEGREGEGRN